MISRATICLYRLRHRAVAAAAPAMISHGTIYRCRLRHTAVATAAPAMISRLLRRSTVVVIAIVRNRSCDGTTAATVQRRRSSQPNAPLLAVSGTRCTSAATTQRRRNISTTVPTTATVPTRVRSSSTDAAPMVARVRCDISAAAASPTPLL